MKEQNNPKNRSVRTSQNSAEAKYRNHDTLLKSAKLPNRKISETKKIVHKNKIDILISTPERLNRKAYSKPVFNKSKQILNTDNSDNEDFLISEKEMSFDQKEEIDFKLPQKQVYSFKKTLVKPSPIIISNENLNKTHFSLIEDNTSCKYCRRKLFNVYVADKHMEICEQRNFN